MCLNGRFSKIQSHIGLFTHSLLQKFINSSVHPSDVCKSSEGPLMKIMFGFFRYTKERWQAVVFKFLVDN